MKLPAADPLAMLKNVEWLISVLTCKADAGCSEVIRESSQRMIKAVCSPQVFAPTSAIAIRATWTFVVNADYTTLNCVFAQNFFYRTRWNWLQGPIWFRCQMFRSVCYCYCRYFCSRYLHGAGFMNSSSLVLALHINQRRQLGAAIIARHLGGHCYCYLRFFCHYQCIAIRLCTGSRNMPLTPPDQVGELHATAPKSAGFTSIVSRFPSLSNRTRPNSESSRIAPSSLAPLRRGPC